MQNDSRHDNVPCSSSVRRSHEVQLVHLGCARGPGTPLLSHLWQLGVTTRGRHGCRQEKTILELWGGSSSCRLELTTRTSQTKMKFQSILRESRALILVRREALAQTKVKEDTLVNTAIKTCQDERRLTRRLAHAMRHATLLPGKIAGGGVSNEYDGPFNNGRSTRTIHTMHRF